jgi:hypothetical protein
VIHDTPYTIMHDVLCTGIYKYESKLLTTDKGEPAARIEPLIEPLTHLSPVLHSGFLQPVGDSIEALSVSVGSNGYMTVRWVGSNGCMTVRWVGSKCRT